MNNKFPQNLKEAIIASVPNAMLMVIGMVGLNLWIYDALTVGHFAVVAPLMFVVAFSMDFIIVGPLIMRFVRRYNIVRLMPIFRVALMAGMLTFLAPIIESGTVISAHQYLTAVPRNYVAALAFQVLIALPFGLFVLSRYRNIISK